MKKNELSYIEAKHLAALKCGRRLSRLFTKRGGGPVLETLRVLCMARMPGDSLLNAYQKSFVGVCDAER